MAGEEDAATLKDLKTHNDQAVGLQGMAPSDGGPGNNPAGKDILHPHLEQAWPWGTLGQGTTSVAPRGSLLQIGLPDTCVPHNVGLQQHLQQWPTSILPQAQGPQMGSYPLSPF